MYKEDNIKIDLKKVECESVGWVCLVENSVKPCCECGFYNRLRIS
jgi:hypothetical protein